jgi:hypothetical protein
MHVVKHIWRHKAVLHAWASALVSGRDRST